MVHDRKKLSEDLGIPMENASRILIEKEKALAQSEIKYHLKSVCTLLDNLRKTDPDYAEAVARDAVKFILARHASIDTLDDVGIYMDSLSENFLEKAVFDKLREDF